MLLASIISCSREEENLNEKTSDTKEIYYYEKIRISFVNNSGVPLLNRDFIWTSSDNSIATVDSEGYITAKNIGNVTITATEKSTNKKYTQKIIVKYPEFKISPKNAELLYNENIAYSIEAPNSVSSQNSELFTWSVSNTRVGTIDNYGSFYAKRIGKTEVTATNKVTKKTYTMDVVVKPMVPDFPLVLDGFGKTKNYIKLNEKRSLTSETENSLVYQTPTNEWGYSIIRKIEYQFENGMLKNIIVNFDPERYNRVEHYYRERYNLLNENYTYDYTRQSNRYWKTFLDDNNMTIYYQRYEEIRQFTTTEVSVKYSKN